MNDEHNYPRHKDEFDYSPLDEIGDAVLDFQNIYESAKTVKKYFQFESEDVNGTFLVRDGKMEAKFVATDFGKNVINLRAILEIVIKTLYPKVSPVFVELSIFDPDDSQADYFYTVLFGREGAIKRYLDELKRNLEAEKGIFENKRYSRRRKENRGALLPTPALYQAAHYAKLYRGMLRAEKLTSENTSIYIGSYKVSVEDAVNLNNETVEKVRLQVEKFFNVVMENAIRSSYGSARVNFALLVPLARPVGVVSSEAMKKMRGGGLFVFGNWLNKNEYRPGRTALRVLNVLHRAVMNVSQDRVESIKALDALHEHAYDTQGHELRKLIPWITNRAPEPILANLRMYFNSLFAISEADVDKLRNTQMQGTYPEEFANGDTLEEFVKNAARVALRIESMIAWCKTHENREGQNYADRDVDTELEKLVDSSLEYLIFEKSAETQFLFDEVTEGTFKHRWYFFSALVSAFRNIPEHQEPFTQIKISIDETDGVLIIINEGKRKYDAVTGKTFKEGKKDWRGSTGTTLKFFVTRFGENPEKVNMGWGSQDEDDFTFLTKLPIPKDFLGTV